MPIASTTAAQLKRKLGAVIAKTISREGLHDLATELVGKAEQLEAALNASPMELA